MTAIIGLGNPGIKYKNTRHNIGFRVIDEFREKNHFPKFRLSKKFNSLVSEEILKNKKIILVKPQTFMNQSGLAVKSIISNCKLPITDLIVIHDDIDLLLGKIKIVKNRGSGGHKGVESIFSEIENKNFVRFRIGIRPQQFHKFSYNTEKFVLEKFNKEEEKIVKQIIKKSVEAIEMLINKGLEKTMTEFN